MDSEQISFEYKLIDHQHNSTHIGIIQNQQLCNFLKSMIQNVSNHPYPLGEELVNSVLMSNIEEMLVITIREKQRDYIYQELKKMLNEEPDEQAVNDCLDRLIDELFRTPIWYQMIDEAKHVVTNNCSTTSTILY